MTSIISHFLISDIFNVKKMYHRINEISIKANVRSGIICSKTLFSNFVKKYILFFP